MAGSQQTSAATDAQDDYGYEDEKLHRFCVEVYGGENIHVGLYETGRETVAEANLKLVSKIGSLIVTRGARGTSGPETRLLDLGAGYGGAARQLCQTLGVRVDCLNLSPLQNQSNREACVALGLQNRVRVIDGSFDRIPEHAAVYDAVYSIDAMIHGKHRETILREAQRVLKPGGDLVFTDLLSIEPRPKDFEDRFAGSLVDIAYSSQSYCRDASGLGLTEVQVVDLSSHLIAHYLRVLHEVESREAFFIKEFGTEYVAELKAALKFPAEAGKSGCLRWGLFHFRKTQA